MPTPDNPVYLHLRVNNDQKRRFWQLCIQHDMSLSEAGRLLIAAVLDGRIKLDELRQEQQDDRQSTDQAS